MILIEARVGIGDLAEGSMQTIFDLMRVAISAIRSLFVVRSEDIVHPALAMIAPRGVVPQSGLPQPAPGHARRLVRARAECRWRLYRLWKWPALTHPHSMDWAFNGLAGEPEAV